MAISETMGSENGLFAGPPVDHPELIKAAAPLEIVEHAARAGKRLKYFTLVLVIDQEQQDQEQGQAHRNGPPRVLLGMKKRGFGAGLYNGFGGKVHADEQVVEAAARELHEETGLLAPPQAFDRVGTLYFDFAGKDVPELFHVAVYRVSRAETRGSPTETDEMAPSWFDQAEIPFDKMWADDRLWFPRVWRNQPFTGEVWFTAKMEISNAIWHDHLTPFPKEA